MDSRKILSKVRKGFTLVELIICMMLISIIISFEAPLISNYEANRQQKLLEGAAAELLSDLRLCQQRSVLEGCINHIYFNNLNNSYMIYTYKGLDNCVIKQRNLPDCVVFDSINSSYKNNKLSFNSKGKPVPYPCTIALKNGKGQVKKLSIAIATDYIYMRDN